MNKSYIYRKHLRCSFPKVLEAVLIIFMLISIGVVGCIYVAEGKLNKEWIIILSIILVILLVMILLQVTLSYFIFLRRFKEIDVTLTDDAIIYNNIKEQMIIPYEYILKVEFPSIRYTGGWVKIIYPEGNIRLTVVLENVGDFIFELKKRLDSIGKSDVYNEKKIFNFFKTASFSDESWERLYDNIKPILIMTFSTLILNILILSYSNTKIDNFFIVAGGIFIPVMGYFISEIVMGSKVKKRVIDGEYKLLERDSKKENRIIRLIVAIFSVIYLLYVLLTYVIL